MMLRYLFKLILVARGIYCVFLVYAIFNFGRLRSLSVKELKTDKYIKVCLFERAKKLLLQF